MKLLKYIAALFLMTFAGQSLLASNLGDSTRTVATDTVTEFTITSPEGPFREVDILSDGLLPTSNTDPNVQRYIDLARTVFGKLRETQNYITNITDATSFELPVGIPKIVGGLNYDIAIHAVRLQPSYAELDVIMQFEVPQNKQMLVFKAEGIKFTSAGGIIGDAKLVLMGDYAINFNGDKSQLILKGSGDSFVTMDCDGFKQMGLDAEVKFSRELVVPEHASRNVVPTGNVSASFKTTLTNWNDLVAQISLPAFHLASVPGMGFQIQDAIFDFSDVRNVPGIVFPEGYNTSTDAMTANLWRGVYVRELSVQLPPQFKKSGTTTRTGFKGTDLILDHQGFTGKLEGKDLITLSNGDLGGWQFSLAHFSVELQKSKLIQGSFNGDIVIPVSSEGTPFKYTAVMSQNNQYQFTVATGKDMNFQLWKASKVTIAEGSALQVSLVNKVFQPKAILHGRMSISASFDDSNPEKKGVELADITFQNLEVQSIKPYIKIGSFSFGSEAAQQKLSQFPVSINNIGVRQVSDTETALDFNLKVNLVGEDAGSFAADGGLSIISKLNTEGGKHKWNVKGIEVRSINIDINGGAFSFKGGMTFYKNDVKYGNGFNGQIDAEFKPGIKVKASAIFGNVAGMRYWYADAMVEFPGGIPVFPSFNIYGFGGGAYYRMKMDNEGGSALGKTASGVIYVPEPKAGLGLKATLAIGTVKEDAFNGDMTFEISFFKGGGIRYISFLGNGKFITPAMGDKLTKLKEKTNKLVSAVKKIDQVASDATGGLLNSATSDQTSINQIHGAIDAGSQQSGQLAARVFISYDFENKVLHGTCEAFVNVAGGIIKGIGPGGRAGWAVLHFAPKEWYVYIGTPDDGIGIGVGIGPIRASTTSYFMMGTKILGSPPPPERVVRVLGGKNLDYMRDENSLKGGAGFAFGSRFTMDTGDLTFLMFYARFAADAGFDIMLKDYGKDTRCKGSSTPIGINGWYANGQAFAAFEGAIGIKVKVFGKKRKVEILEIGVGAILQAKLPNPFWMRGIVGGQFSALGGLVKGKCSFEVTLGEECEIVTGNVLDDIKVISDITPAQGTTNVSVFNSPQVVFNMEVNKVFEIPDPATGAMRKFRIKLDYFTVKDGSVVIAGSSKWNSTSDVIAFTSNDLLPGEKTITASAQISFEEMVSGAWTPVLEEGKAVIESRSVTFVTGKQPDFIPQENVLYTYPVAEQLNFHVKESATGYILLNRGQPLLFQADPKWVQKVRFKTAGGVSTLADVSYNSTEKKVSFAIPQTLALSTVFTCDVLKLPAQSAGAIDKNVSLTYNKTAAVDTEVKKKVATGSIETLEEKELYSLKFRSSKYAKFADKIAALPIIGTVSDQVTYRAHVLYHFYEGSEYFDEAEISGAPHTGSKPLVYLEAVVAGNGYYNDQVYPLVYAGYPLDGDIKINHRNTADLGNPPVKAMSIYQTPATHKLSTFGGTVSATYSALLYKLPVTMEKDFNNIQAQVVNRYIHSTTVSDRVSKIIYGNYPLVTKAGYAYKFKVRYRLPGASTFISEKEVTITY